MLVRIESTCILHTRRETFVQDAVKMRLEAVAQWLARRGFGLYVEHGHGCHPGTSLREHDAGGAVDVTLFSLATGQMLNMGSSIGVPSDPPDEVAAAYRGLLRQAMVSQQFAPAPSVWWHFSYGTASWAQQYGYLTYPYATCIRMQNNS